MNCCVIQTYLGDHDIEEEEYSIVTNLSCPIVNLMLKFIIQRRRSLENLVSRQNKSPT